MIVASRCNFAADSLGLACAWGFGCIAVWSKPAPFGSSHVVFSIYIICRRSRRRQGRNRRSRAHCGHDNAGASNCTQGQGAARGTRPHLKPHTAAQARWVLSVGVHARIVSRCCIEARLTDALVRSSRSQDSCTLWYAGRCHQTVTKHICAYCEFRDVGCYGYTSVSCARLRSAGTGTTAKRIWPCVTSSTLCRRSWGHWRRRAGRGLPSACRYT